MNIGLCKCCGSAYDVEEVNDGYCLNCAPDAGAVMSLHEEPEIDIRRVVSDCE
jgi:hypothetical protein